MGRLLLRVLENSHEAACRSRLLCHDTQQLAEACLLQHFPPTYRVLGCLGWQAPHGTRLALGTPWYGYWDWNWSTESMIPWSPGHSPGPWFTTWITYGSANMIQDDPRSGYLTMATIWQLWLYTGSIPTYAGLISHDCTHESFTSAAPTLPGATPSTWNSWLQIHLQFCLLVPRVRPCWKLRLWRGYLLITHSR